MRTLTWRWSVLLGLFVLAACTTSRPDPGGIRPEDHGWFPIAAGASHALGKAAAEGPLACESCHLPTADSFADFSCVGCHLHGQVVTDLLHGAVPGYAYQSAQCLACHPDGAKVAFSHAGLTDRCALCHDVGTPFAALPLAGSTHPDTLGADCGNCHHTLSWDGGSLGPAALSHDPAADVPVMGLLPSWSGTSILSLDPLAQLLPMPMNHAAPQVAGAASSACANCHDAAPASYYPGRLHSSLANLALAAPSACGACHAPSRPQGFVGPNASAPPRNPASGEMRHDAVAWVNGAPTATPLLTADCAVCHVSPTELQAATWATGPVDGGSARYHLGLRGAGLSQPGSCLDCHANSRPTALLTAASAGLPPNVTYDHQVAEALGDCAACHAASAPGFADWTSGRFHLAGSSNPGTCLPCHDGQRPTSTAGWQSATYTQAPFDYVTNARGVTHGAGQDCARCHPGPGTGAWGGTPNWQGGNFVHGAGTLSATTCISCHMGQRPDLLPGATAAGMAALLGFDHSRDGQGDCFGCHQATVAAGTYRNLYNPSSGTLPNGDWKGGTSYPGAFFVASVSQFISVTAYTLNRSGPNNLVTSSSASTGTYYNGMQHTSPALPAALNAGPSGAPDNSKCWHCHTSSGTTVTSFADGRYHPALTNYRPAPDAGVAAFPQPTARCDDCHAQMRPAGVLLRAASNLVPMDHAATFTQAVNIGGVSANGAAGLDCSVCHANAGSTWANGVFHARISTAVPQDCTVCHYPLMADAARSDLTSGTRYAMKHRSPLLTFQNCRTCHAAALGRSTTTPAVATLWQGGTYHPNLAAQPSACVDCHAVSDPTGATQGSVQYALTQGGTATNRAQWMNHASPVVAGRDCALCHLADAKVAGSAWSKATVLHRPGLTVGTCRECHGLTNGGGSVPGTNNNLPAGLLDSATLSTASQTAGSGIPAGTYDQISHGDVNVTSKDCRFCHTQAGAASTAPAAGREWAQARFHARFTSASPLVMNTTTGRCSNCHLNLRPGSGYPGQSHATFTGVSGSTDCSACHSWPGAGGTAAPNWKGAVGGAPAFISVGGFSVPQPPASNGTTVAQGIANLPHPAGSDCAACHPGGVGGRRATGYDHASSLINSNCRSCHEAGSDLVGTPWNGATSASSGLGSTRPITIVGLVCSFDGNTRPFTNDFRHFYPQDCKECHPKPSGTVNASSGATYRTRWKFAHTKSLMSNPTTCNMCHASPNNLPK